MEPHDLTMTVLGAALLWFGWFGFNAGSALGANGLAAMAFLVTNFAAAMGALTWMTVSWFKHGQPSVLGAAAGAVAGLVGDHPGGRLRQSRLGDRDRLRRAASSASSRWSCSRSGCASTTRSMSSPSMASAASGARWRPGSSRTSRSTGSERTASSSATRSSS